MNTEQLLEDIYNRQVAKFGDCSYKELISKLGCEFLELQEANRKYWMCGEHNKELADDIQLEIADIIIIANRMWKEYDCPIAWGILSKYYDYESSKWVKIKWDIVEKREYSRVNGQWQHIPDYKNNLTKKINLLD